MNKVKNIFEHPDCLSEEMLMKYISGTLAPAEKHVVEKHLIDCEMCSDALEGLSMIGDKRKISNITSDLNRKIQSRAEQKEVKVIFIRQYRTQLAVAASIILILGLVWFFRSNMKEMDSASAEKIFADKFEPPPSELSQKAIDEGMEDKEKAAGDEANMPATIPEQPAASVDLPAEKNGVKTGKDVSAGENFSWTVPAAPTQNAEKMQADAVMEEKAEEYRYKNAEVTVKGEATSVADVQARDESEKFSKEVSTDGNRKDVLKEKDKKDETKAPAPAFGAVATGTTAGPTTSGNQQVVVNNAATTDTKTYQWAATPKESTVKTENKKADADEKQAADKTVKRTQADQGDVLALESAKSNKNEESLAGKKSTEKRAVKAKESTPNKVSGGYYEVQTTTSAPQSQTQTNYTQTERANNSLDSVKASVTVTNELVQVDTAMVKYDKKDYAGAIADFEATLKQNPADEKALFYSAVSYLSLGEADKAIVNLNKIVANTTGKYYDEAQWYLSLAYIKKNDSQNARKNLEVLQKNSKSKYQKQADETLKQLNK